MEESRYMDPHRSACPTPDRPVVIVGAGHQGRNVADILVRGGTAVAGFLDDTRTLGERVNGVAVLGGFDRAADGELLQHAAFIVALGDNRIRRELSRAIWQRGGVLASAIHPAADVSPSARLGAGICVQAFARILSNASVGDFALVEGLTTIGSDVVLGEAAFVGPGAQVTAGAALGEGAYVGANAIVVGPARVGAHTVVGAGAVVRGDLPERVLAVGAPCRIVRPLSAAESPFFAQPRSTGNSVPLT